MDGPREDPSGGFASVPEQNPDGKVRARSDSFADHYSQASMFWRSMTAPEQRHIVSAFVFELTPMVT